MVLQQNAEAAVWGFASPGSAVTVTPSWDEKPYSVKADASGHWTARVKTPAAGYETYTISVSGDGSALTIQDVLVGEVWLASGQSNMEIPLRGFTNCPIEGYNEVITRAPARNKVRMFYVRADQSDEPLEEIRLTDGWQGADPNTIPEMSAVGYFFACKLNEVLDIPIGIVAFARGGARVESWLPRATLASYGTEDLTPAGVEKIIFYQRPFQMYNAMEVPLQGYTAHGFIWYQGCSNVGHEDQFVARMSDLVKQWRSDWGDTDCSMPFYMVEIAPYLYSQDNGDSGARLRKAQHDAAKAIPNSGIVCTNDLVAPFEADNIHPCKKEPIGNRLAYIALNREYGFKRVACDSPEATELFKRQATAHEINVRIANCPNGIDRIHEIEGLEVCGADGIWQPVRSIRYNGDTMSITVDDVKDPKAVRYGWADFKPGNIHSVEGLPLVPFNLRLGD
jgi:sialate O-acetylesterase